MKLLRKKLQSEAGLTVIELAIAGVVLVVGMLAIMGLLGLAIGNNGRSKIDSTATMLNQVVVEQIAAQLAGGGPGVITDCANNTWNIDYQSAPPPNGWGAALNGSQINFTQANPPAGAFMDYVECVTQPNGNVVQTTYDVRWNVQGMPSGTRTYLVTVGAKPKNLGQGRFTFALPVNMRMYVGGH
jgi:hypothetical protein